MNDIIIRSQVEIFSRRNNMEVILFPLAISSLYSLIAILLPPRIKRYFVSKLRPTHRLRIASRPRHQCPQTLCRAGEMPVIDFVHNHHRGDRSHVTFHARVGRSTRHTITSTKNQYRSAGKNCDLHDGINPPAQKRCLNRIIFGART